MWLYRGVQSAVFYYATCTPCAMSIDRRKRKKEAVRSQRLKAKCDTELVSDQPRPFSQPTPFSTNEGWREEIALGPRPPARRGRNRNNARTDSWDAKQSSQVKKDKSGGLMHPLGERLKSMRYQREDEPLWGEEVRGSSIGFAGLGRADPNEPAKYYAARVPPVNDLHPPIVSGPRCRAETRWMLQPPPSAKVMAGKERFDVSPRNSNGGFAGDYPSRIAQTRRNRDEKESGRTSNEADNGPFDEIAIQDEGPRRPSPARVRGGSGSAAHDDFDFARNSRSDSMSTMDHSDDQSLRSSWKYPDTPATRPVSKATDGSEKVPPRLQISKTLSTMQRAPKQKIHVVHLEIDDDSRDDIELGHIRPWRWSMDI